MTHKIRTTMQPGVELEVGDAEYLDLKRQGLLVDDSDQASAGQREQPAPSAPATPDQAQAPAPAAPSKAPKAANKEG